VVINRDIVVSAFVFSMCILSRRGGDDRPSLGHCVISDRIPLAVAEIDFVGVCSCFRLWRVLDFCDGAAVVCLSYRLRKMFIKSDDNR
jgi:hypothetical protein